MMLKLKLQYFGHLMQRVDSLEKTSDARRDWGQEEKGTTEDKMAGWHHWFDGRESQWTPGVGDGQEAWRAAIHGVAKSRIRLSDWSDLIWYTFKAKKIALYINDKNPIYLFPHFKITNSWPALCHLYFPHPLSPSHIILK